ncbi:unnamed protein product [Phytophthora lilii]|uniref:Unnamed protein product n=1 Tax=Phytophthora lilii TaxID=2077276 RepID=A0A9W6WN12_9STRA|nr:unnamed protein product [Phytophthora lilii]
MLDVYSTSQFPRGWARINENDNIDNFDDLKSVTPLDCSRFVGHYFPSDIPSWHSGVVYAVAEVSMRTLVSINPRSTVTSLPDDKPTCANEDWKQENDRYTLGPKKDDEPLICGQRAGSGVLLCSGPTLELGFGT